MTPKYVEFNDVTGVVFGDKNIQAFDDFVISMDATRVPNKDH